MSVLSDALAAMDKATPGPWIAYYDCGGAEMGYHNIWTGAVVDQENYGSVAEEVTEKNAKIIAAAPDALAWIKEALPWLESLRDALRGAEGSTHLDQFYALDALIAKMEEGKK